MEVSPVFWRVKLGIFRLNFRIDLERKVWSTFQKQTSQLSGSLTFLNEGGTVTPGGTEKQRPNIDVA
jgi:hypothetical protein